MNAVIGIIGRLLCSGSADGRRSSPAELSHAGRNFRHLVRCMGLGVPGKGRTARSASARWLPVPTERHCVPLEGDVASGSWTPKVASSGSRLDSEVQQGYITDQQLSTLDQRRTRSGSALDSGWLPKKIRPTLAIPGAAPTGIGSSAREDPWLPLASAIKSHTTHHIIAASHCNRESSTLKYLCLRCATLNMLGPIWVTALKPARRVPEVGRSYLDRPGRREPFDKQLVPYIACRRPNNGGLLCFTTCNNGSIFAFDGYKLRNAPREYLLPMSDWSRPVEHQFHSNEDRL